MSVETTGKSTSSKHFNI